MIALDTNILVRYIVQDDTVQSPLATVLVESLTTANPGFIPLVCLAELYWVLDHIYKLTSLQLSEAIEALLTTDTLVLEEDLRVQKALTNYQSGSADFDDCLIMETAISHGCTKTFTFDRKAAKTLDMTLLT